MTTRTRLTLIRHGTTDANTRGLFMGHTDALLSPEGEREVAALAERLADTPIDVLVTSDLARARATAEAITDRRPELSARLEPRLREMHLGAFEGRLATEIHRDHPDLIRRWVEDPADVRMLGDGAESLREVQARAWEAVCEQVSTNPKGHVVVVSHTFVILAIVCEVVGVPLRQFRRFYIDRASISEIRWGRFGPTLHRLNDTGHLPADPGAKVAPRGLIPAPGGTRQPTATD